MPVGGWCQVVYVKIKLKLCVEGEKLAPRGL